MPRPANWWEKFVAEKTGKFYQYIQSQIGKQYADHMRELSEWSGKNPLELLQMPGSELSALNAKFLARDTAMAVPAALQETGAATIRGTAGVMGRMSDLLDFLRSKGAFEKKPGQPGTQVPGVLPSVRPELNPQVALRAARRTAVNPDLPTNAEAFAQQAERMLAPSDAAYPVKTIPGEIVKEGGKTALQTLLMKGYAGTGGRVSQASRLAGQQYGETYGNAYEQARLAKESPERADIKASAHGLTAALGTAAGYSTMLEGPAGKLLGRLGITNPGVVDAVKKAVAAGAEGEALNVLNNWAENRGAFDQSHLMESLRGVIAGKLVGAPTERALTEYSVINPANRLVNPERAQNNRPRGVEERLFANQRSTEADMLSAMATDKHLREKYGSDVWTEIYHYKDAKQAQESGANIKVPELSDKAKAAMSDPAFRNLEEAARERYGNTTAMKAPGPNPVPSGEYVHRIVTGGTEPSQSGGGGAMRTKAGSENARSIMAIDTPEGRRVVTISGDTAFHPTTGEAIGKVTTAAEAMSDRSRAILKDTLTLLERNGQIQDRSLDNLSSQIDGIHKEIENQRRIISDQESRAASDGKLGVYDATAEADARAKLKDLSSQIISTLDAINETVDRSVKQLTHAGLDPQSKELIQRITKMREDFALDAKQFGYGKDPNWGESQAIQIQAKKSENEYGFRDVGKLTQATSQEITDQTGVTYHPDALHTTLRNFVETGQAQRGTQFLYDLKGSALAPANSGGPIPSGFSEPPPGFPQLKGHIVDSRLMPMLERLAQAPKDPNLWHQFEQGLTSLGFANPAAHLKNPISHFGESLGLVGGAKDILSGAVQADIDRAIDIVRSIREGKPSQEAIDLLNSGAKFMSIGDVRGDWTKYQLQAPSIGQQATMERNPNSRLSQIAAEDTNTNSGTGPIRGAIDAMNKAGVWQLDDVLRTARILANQREGLSLPEAVSKARDQVAFYDPAANRVDSDSALARTWNRITEAARNSPFFRFQNYETDAANILANKFLNPAKAATSGDIGGTLKGVDKILGAGATSAALYRILTPALQGFTGNENVEYSPGGSVHEASKVKELLAGAYGAQPGSYAPHLPDVARMQKAMLSQFIPSASTGVLIGAANAASGIKPLTNPSDALDATLLNPTPATANAAKTTLKGVAGPAIMGLGPVLDAASGPGNMQNVVPKMLLGGRGSYSDAEELAMKMLRGKRGAAPPNYTAAQEIADMAELRRQLGQENPDQNIINSLIERVGPDKYVNMLVNEAESGGPRNPYAKLSGMIHGLSPLEAVQVGEVSKKTNPQEWEAIGPAVKLKGAAVSDQDIIPQDARGEFFDRINRLQGLAPAPPSMSKPSGLAPAPPSMGPAPPPAAQPIPGLAPVPPSMRQDNPLESTQMRPPRP